MPPHRLNILRGLDYTGRGQQKETIIIPSQKYWSELRKVLEDYGGSDDQILGDYPRLRFILGRFLSESSQGMRPDSWKMSWEDPLRTSAMILIC